jgi:hypothetical protein
MGRVFPKVRLAIKDSALDATGAGLRLPRPRSVRQNIEAHRAAALFPTVDEAALASLVPLKVEATAQSLDCPAPSALEQTSPHLWRWNWRHDARIELVYPTLDLALPSDVRVIVRVPIQAGEQCLGEGCTVLDGQGQQLLQERSGIAFHQSIVATSPLRWRRRFRFEMGNSVGEPKLGSTVFLG